MKTDPHKESRLRSIFKGLSWRILASTSIFIIAYYTTGNINLAMEIGLIEFVVKFILYYFHERIWQQIPRGTIRKILKFR